MSRSEYPLWCFWFGDGLQIIIIHTCASVPQTDGSKFRVFTVKREFDTLLPKSVFPQGAKGC